MIYRSSQDIVELHQIPDGSRIYIVISRISLQRGPTVINWLHRTVKLLRLSWFNAYGREALSSIGWFGLLELCKWRPESALCFSYPTPHRRETPVGTQYLCCRHPQIQYARRCFRHLLAFNISLFTCRNPSSLRFHGLRCL